MRNISQRTASQLIDSEVVRTLCPKVQFEPGALLRRKGQHYRDMYVLADGSVEVDLESGDASERISLSEAGIPIGEISFLRGWAATATVTAKTAASAFVIDDHILSQLELEAPALTASLMRRFAETAEERTSINLTSTRSTTSLRTRSVVVHFCRNKELLEGAQRLRYEVYCKELQRNSPFADHHKMIITDDLDRFGHTFVAMEASEIIGTLRANFSSEGPLGVLEELYGMKASAHHPSATAICTKFIVKKAKRGSSTASKLISAMVRFGMQNSIKECFIDCIPKLLPYYKAVGFKVAGEKFLHRENGPSIPMRLDVQIHGETLCQERGVREDLSIYVKAQVIRIFDRIRQRGSA